MKMLIKSTLLELTPSLKIYIDDKFQSLHKLIKNSDLEGVVEVQIEVARNTKHHKKGKVFYAEANLHLPNKSLRASSEGEDIREAIDLLKDKLWRLLEKHKEKY